MSIDNMKVNRSILIPVKDRSQESIDGKFHGVAIFQTNTVYKKKTSAGLLQQYSELVASDTSGKYFQRTSEDNGKTWSEPSLIFEPEKTNEGVIRYGESTFLLDGEKDAILHFYNYHLYPGNHFTGDVGKYTRLFLRISPDGGETFSAPQQIIQKGFDEHNWAKDVVYGRNCIAISFCAPIRTNAGKILLPICRRPLDYSGKSYPNYHAGCFIGEWKNNRIEWELSEMLKISSEISKRGLCEPTIAELYDGSLLMIMRGSNASITHMPGYKWHSISKDGGYSWSEPSALKYDTEENFFSPSTGSRLIRNSKNKKLYWIGNIVKENPDGNSPRYPLQIAEVDENKKSIKENTVEIIEDKQKDDSSSVQFSNFKVYEDRETNEFVLTMARLQERSEKDLTSPTYQYRIEVLKCGK